MMTLFDEFQELDIVEAMMRDYESILSLFVSRIDDLKKIFTPRQIQVLRQLLDADYAISKNEHRKLQEELKKLYEDELKCIPIP